MEIKKINVKGTEYQLGGSGVKTAILDVQHIDFGDCTEPEIDMSHLNIDFAKGIKLVVNDDVLGELVMFGFNLNYGYSWQYDYDVWENYEECISSCDFTNYPFYVNISNFLRFNSDEILMHKDKIKIYYIEKDDLTDYSFRYEM